MEGASAQAAAEDLDLASVGSHSDAGGSSGSRPGSTATTDAVLSEVLHMMQQLSAQVTDQGDQLKGLQKRVSEGDRASSGSPPPRGPFVTTRGRRDSARLSSALPFSVPPPPGE